MKRFEQLCDDFFEMLGNIIISFIRRVAPFAVPAAPAYFFGHAVYSAVDADSIAVFVGIVAALGLESAGILAAHYTVKFLGGGQENKGLVSAILAAVYLIIGIAAIWLLDGLTNDAKFVGTAMFLIAGIVYLLTGLEVDTRAKEAKTAKQEQEAAERVKIEEQEKADQLAWERSEDQKDRDLHRQLKRQAQEDNKAIRLAKLQTQQGTNNKINLDTSKTDWRTLSPGEQAQIAKLSPVEIVQMFNVSHKTAGRWLERAAKVSQNGHG